MEYVQQIFEMGGPLIWVLLGLSLVGSFVFVERLVYLHRCTIGRKEFLTGILNLVAKGRVVEALTVCQENTAPLAHVVQAGLMEIKRERGVQVERMREAAWLQMPLLERRVHTLEWIARIAPLVGLLGSLLPLTLAFLRAGDAGPFPGNDFIFSLLGQAMVTTCAGFFVALCAVSGAFVLNNRLDHLVHDLELGAAELLNGLHAPRAEEGEEGAHEDER